MIIATAGLTTNWISAPNDSSIPGTAISTTISAPAPTPRTMVSPPLVRATPSVGGSTGSTGSTGVLAALNAIAAGSEALRSTSSTLMLVIPIENSISVTSVAVVKVKDILAGTGSPLGFIFNTVALVSPSTGRPVQPAGVLKLLRVTRFVSIANTTSMAFPESVTPVWDTSTIISVPDPETVAEPDVSVTSCAEACPVNISNAKAVINKRLFFKNITNSSIENGIGKPQQGNFPIHRRIT